MNDAEMGQALMRMGESMAQVVEAAAGYRQRCEEAGFSKEAAEQMAVAYHQSLVRIACGS